jgi:ankyrin repeat protein
LLEYGADVNAIDSEGKTALMYACYSDYSIEIVKLLLERGAYITMTDNKGNTPLMIAQSRDATEIVKLLLEKGVTR